MFRTLAIAAIAAALAAPAFASDQLARSLGVEPGVYSTAELAELKHARANDDHATVFEITRRGGTEVGRGVSSKSFDAGSAQLARSLGVEPGRFSTAELATLKSAVDSDDHSTIRFILDGGLSG